MFDWLEGENYAEFWLLTPQNTERANLWQKDELLVRAVSHELMGQADQAQNVPDAMCGEQSVLDQEAAKEWSQKSGDARQCFYGRNLPAQRTSSSPHSITVAGVEQQMLR